MIKKLAAIILGLLLTGSITPVLAQNSQLPSVQWGSTNPANNSSSYAIFNAPNYGSCIWDGSHDVAACINLATAAAFNAGGGTVILPTKNSNLINTSFTIPAGVNLNCQQNHTALGVPANPTPTPSGGIRLDSTKTIYVNGAGLINCIIIRRGMTIPSLNASAYAGTALSSGVGGVHGADTLISNVSVIGFAKCYDQNGTSSNDNTQVYNVNCDATDAWDMRRSYGGSVVFNLKTGPFGTQNYPGQTTTNNLRTGAGLTLDGPNDNTEIYSYTDYGHYTGIAMAAGFVTGCCSINFNGTTWLDSNRKALSVDTGLVPYPSNIHFDSLQIVGAWGNNNPKAFISSGSFVFDKLEFNSDTSTTNCMEISNSAQVQVTYGTFNGCAQHGVAVSGAQTKFSIASGRFTNLGALPQIYSTGSAENVLVGFGIYTDSSLFSGDGAKNITSNIYIEPPATIEQTIIDIRNISSGGKRYELISGGASGLFSGGKIGLWDYDNSKVRWYEDNSGAFNIVSDSAGANALRVYDPNSTSQFLVFSFNAGTSTAGIGSWNGASFGGTIDLSGALKTGGTATLSTVKTPTGACSLTFTNGLLTATTC